MIPVKSRGKCFYITIEGVKIELPDHTVTAESFQNGLGIIKVQSGKTYYKDEYLNGVRYGAVNKNGELIIPLIYEKLTWSDDSYISAVFRVNSFTKTNFKFNSKGEIVINNDTFKGVYSCEKLKDNTYRIISKEGPVNISAFSLDNDEVDYNKQVVCIYAKGEEIVELSVIDITDEPLILKGNVKRIVGKDITLSEVDYYDYEEDDWIYDNNYILTYAPQTIIIKNGEIVKENKIEVGKEVTILKVNDKEDRVCGVIIIED